jgi:hypothetical protein
MVGVRLAAAGRIRPAIALSIRAAAFEYEPPQAEQAHASLGQASLQVIGLR